VKICCSLFDEAQIAAVADKHPSSGIRGDGMGHVEFAGGRPFLALGQIDYSLSGKRMMKPSRFGIRTLGKV
jgi:hypothetical protein